MQRASAGPDMNPEPPVWDLVITTQESRRMTGTVLGYRSY
jgi:hypothetical protein